MSRSIAFAPGEQVADGATIGTKTMEATMRRIPRSEWIEWLDGLHISGPVAIVSDDRAGPGNGGWIFRSADYDPFEDVLEIVLDDDQGRLRVLLESPSEILAVGTDANPEHVTIIAPDGPLVITRSLDRPTPVCDSPGARMSGAGSARERSARSLTRPANQPV